MVVKVPLPGCAKLLSRQSSGPGAETVGSDVFTQTANNGIRAGIEPQVYRMGPAVPCPGSQVTEHQLKISNTL